MGYHLTTTRSRDRDSTDHRKRASDPLCIVAHRGASHAAPENTLAAFRRAWREGADRIEADFRLTKDGRVVALHDADTLRVAGVRRVVARCTYRHLRALDVGSRFGARWKGERVPTLEQVLRGLPRGKGLHLEVKGGPGMVPVLGSVLERSGVDARRVAIHAFDPRVIAAARRVLPAHEAVLLFHFRKHPRTGRWNATRTRVVRTALRIGAQGVGIGIGDRLDATLARMLRRAGLKLHVWTVNDRATARRVIALGAVSITTDDPGAMA